MLRIKCLLTVLLFTLFASAQSSNSIISGTILDENGEPLIGASLKLKKSGQGTVTDIDGNFKLSVSELSEQIIISYIGYTSLQMTADKL